MQVHTIPCGCFDSQMLPNQGVHLPAASRLQVTPRVDMTFVVKDI